MSAPLTIRDATYALRVVRRRAGGAAVVYRRRLTEKGKERLERIAAIGPLAFSVGAPLLREAVRATAMLAAEPRLGPAARLVQGPFYPLDADWGARVACYALVAAGLRDADRLHRAAVSLQHADGAEAAWWLGLMGSWGRRRAVRALRILTEAVE